MILHQPGGRSSSKTDDSEMGRNKNTEDDQPVQGHSHERQQLTHLLFTHLLLYPMSLNNK